MGMDGRIFSGTDVQTDASGCNVLEMGVERGTPLSPSAAWCESVHRPV